MLLLQPFAKVADLRFEVAAPFEFAVDLLIGALHRLTELLDLLEQQVALLLPDGSLLLQRLNGVKVLNLLLEGGLLCRCFLHQLLVLQLQLQTFNLEGGLLELQLHVFDGLAALKRL